MQATLLTRESADWKCLSCGRTNKEETVYKQVYCENCFTIHTVESVTLAPKDKGNYLEVVELGNEPENDESLLYGCDAK